MQYILVSLIFYFIGSFSPAYLTAKYVQGIDIREVNSKNAGASNITMTLGFRYGAFVAILDIVKGILPIIILRILFPDNHLMWFTGGISTVLGHVFPFYLGFRGGKGTATFIGVLLATNPVLGLVLSLILIVATIATDYIAIGTLFLILLAPIMLIIFDYQLGAIIWVIVYSLLSFYKHFGNFVRIYRKQELGLRQTFKK